MAYCTLTVARWTHTGNRPDGHYIYYTMRMPFVKAIEQCQRMRTRFGYRFHHSSTVKGT